MESKRLYELGIEAYNRNDFEGAFNYLNQSAMLGDTEATYLLAEMYREGKGTKKDFDKALSLYKKLLNATDDFFISDFTELHNGQLDIKEVINWFVEAANAGNLTAANKVKELEECGFCIEEKKELISEAENKIIPKKEDELLYELGLEAYGKKDYEAALDKFKKAAELGNDDAMYYLGRMYKFGEGIEGDDTKSLEWYKKAAELGNFKAMMKLEFMGLSFKFKEND